MPPLKRPSKRKGPDPVDAPVRPSHIPGKDSNTHSLTQKQARSGKVVPAWRRGPGGTWSLTIDEAATVLGISTVAVIKAIKPGNS